MTTIITPWLQQPYFGTGPDAGNPLIEWDVSHGGDTYIDNNGGLHSMIQGGEWVPDITAPAIPTSNGSSIPNDPNNPNERWLSADPTNPVWKAGTLYGKDGYVYWVQSDLCKKIISELHANPSPIPTPAPTPAPLPTEPPRHIIGFWEELDQLISRWKNKLL